VTHRSGCGPSRPQAGLTLTGIKRSLALGAAELTVVS